MVENKNWAMLRSDIYIRDNGICWVCNRFVELRDYDLGHLVDRCNGGHDDYDNLAVMHKICNLKKPRHTTLEAAMKWKLTPDYLTKPKPVMPYLYQEPSIIINEPNSPTKYRYTPLREEDERAIEQLIVEYFNNRPELLENGDGYNRNRVYATRELSYTFDIPIAKIRAILLRAGLVTKYKPQVRDGSQYFFIFKHLDKLLEQYNSIKYEPIYKQPKLLGMSPFCMDIMFYLSGILNKVSKRNIGCISRRVSQLKIPVRKPMLLLREG